MEFNCRNQPSCMKKYTEYCCAYRKELLRNNNFEKNIEIIPRVIICNSLQKCETYSQSLEIRNLGTISRRMKFFVDSNSDVSFKIKGSTELLGGDSITVDIYVEPTTKKDINHHRYFYAFTEHPDIVFEVPIIVIKIPPEVFVPSSLCLHKVPANTATHYQFVVYNPFDCEFSYTTSSTYENITVSPSENVIPAKDFCKLLLTAKIPSQASTASLVVTVNGKRHPILVHMETSDKLIHLSSHVVAFDDVYMGLKHQKHLYICNKSLEDVSFQWTTSTNSPSEEISPASDELNLNNIFTIKNRRGCLHSLNSALSIITFCPPNTNYPEDEEPPFKTKVIVYLSCPLMNYQFYELQITGAILGPNIDITPRDTDFGTIYLGQVQCLSFEVKNKGPIDGEVYVRECTDESDIEWKLTPSSIKLKPGRKDTFALKFCRRNLGKFLTKLTFKIRCGNFIPILLRGNTIAVQVKIWPDSFEFGEIPICVPQKRFALIANPLPVPIVVEPSIVNEGTDDPLILCVNYSKAPLHMRKTPCDKVERTPIETEETEMETCYSDFELGKKSDLVEPKRSDLSWIFEDKVLNDVPAMAEDLLKSIRLQNPQSQSESGTKIIDAALDCILNRSDYFDELKEKQNFMNLDWEHLPHNPKEIAIENERFYLKPNESKSFPVIVIPNSTGPTIRRVQFRSCPLGGDQSDIKTVVNSSDMINILELQYRSIAPDLVYESEIKLQQSIYVDKLENIQMHFRNNQNVPGFVYFKLPPVTNDGILTVPESHNKFFIQSGEVVTVPASVMYLQVGNISVTGEFQIIGKFKCCPFKISAKVLPPELRFTPKNLFQRQRVLESTTTKIVFENICPTIAKFSVALKNENYQSLEPLGAHLAPGQEIVITVHSRFLDPGVYKNFIILNLIHCEEINIPIQFNVEGIPLSFEPNLKEGFDCGSAFTSNKFREYPITITDLGQKSYRVLFTKQKPKGNVTPPMVFDIQPPGITITSKESRLVKIILNTSNEIEAEELYFVDVMGDDNIRLKLFKLLCKCDVILPKLVWSKPEVRLESGNENGSADTVAISNSTPLQINVSLAVLGFFYLIDLDTNEGGKSHSFKLEGRTVKQFLVKLNTSEIDPLEMSQSFEGIVNCKANGKPQKSLGLYAKMINPGLKICIPNVTFFTQNTQAYAHVSLRNDGFLPAKFCWRYACHQLCRTTFDERQKHRCAKTISETILSLPDELVPVIPKAMKTTAEVCFSDDEYSDDDSDSSESHLNSTLSTQSPNDSEVSKDSVSKRESEKFGKAAEINKISKPTNEPAPEQEVPFVCKKPLQIVSSEEAQITIEEVLDYLGLPRPKARSSTGDCRLTARNEYGQGDEVKCAVKFQAKEGVILPKTIHKSYIFLPCVRKGWTFLGKYQLDVEGGKTETLELKVTSHKGRIQVSQTNVDVSRQVWYKQRVCKMELCNPSPFAVKITVFEGMDKGDMCKQLVHGTVKITSQNSFTMMPKEKSNLICKLTLGLCYNFIEDIGIEVNNSTTGFPIRFRGSGIMPIVLPKSLDNMTRKSLDTVASYFTMRHVYEDVEKKNNTGSRNVKDDESNISTLLSVSEEEEEDESDVSTEACRTRRPHDFVALHYSDETGPRALEIERLIETWKFKAELEECVELRLLFHQFYCKCMQGDVWDFDPVVNLKFTVCRPVPWEMSAYVLNMGDIGVNETKEFRIDLSFLGPGRVFLSARTRIVIPGLTAWFNDCHNVNVSNSFVFYLHSPDEKDEKLYRNMSERDTDECSSQSEVKPMYGHAFDFDSSGVHNREKRLSRVPKIKEHYNTISFPNKSVKNPLVLAEVCQVDERDWDNSTFQLVLLFTALSDCFEINQTINDYLLIDVHLGLTLPIQLQGRITEPQSI